MSAYVIAEVEVIDAAGYEDYRRQALRAIRERTTKSHLVVTEGV